MITPIIQSSAISPGIAEALAQRHSELQANATKVSGWLEAEIAQARARMQAATTRPGVNLEVVAESERAGLRTAMALAAASQEDLLRFSCRLRLIEVCQTHVSQRLADLVADDDQTAAGLLEIFAGVFAILATQAQATEGSK